MSQFPEYVAQLMGLLELKKEGNELDRQVFLRMVERGDEFYNDTDFLHGVAKMCAMYTYEEVARVVVALVVLFPHQAYKWLVVLNFYLNENEGGEQHLQPRQGQFHQGIVLGLFQAAVWNDRNWKDETFFKRSLSGVVYDFIVSVTPTESPALGFESHLSKAIKAYVRPDGGLGIRTARVFNLIERLSEKLQNVSNEEIAPLRRMVADQLVFGMLGHISTGGRLRSLSLLKCDIFEMGAKKE